MSTSNNPNDKETVGEVGSQVDGDPNNNQDNQEQVDKADLAGKKVDADPTEPEGQPADQ
ncbi:hypothetical protein [Aridibaculum aurantiacum]|uniref:hypothetical protein n=1 Tax=Aridibaculum aurantiacum TaxID=2810307 RepID=UPI001A974D32|nr:hypothetical protein [Aridibaculum aurantiacum]